MISVEKNFYVIKKDIIIILISYLLYLLNCKVLKKISINILHIFFNCYFNDILAGIIILSILNVLLSFKGKRLVGIFETAILILFIGIIWEYTPKVFNKIAVSDFYDIIAYEFGGLVYWHICYLCNKKKGGYLC